MDIEQQLRGALAPCVPRPELRSIILARISSNGASTRGSGRGHSRTILFGTILAVAAAAAMLVVNLNDAPKQEPEAAATAVAPVVERFAVMESGLPAVRPPPVVEVPQEAETPKVPVATLTSFTVRVLPLQSGDADPAVKATLDAFYMAFLSELRAVPGLSMMVADPVVLAYAALPDFEIAVRGSRAGENQFSISVAGTDKAGLESKQKSVTDGKPAPPVAASFQVQDLQGGLEPGVPEGMAAALVASFRKRIFPEDPSLQLQLQNQLLDASLDPRMRLRALTDIGGMKVASRRGDALRDPEIVRGAIALATTASDSSIRAHTWRTMRGIRNPELVEPAIASLRDVDGEVRLEAVALLQEDFASDQRARDALEAVVREESRPLVRALAQRAVQGEAAWSDYIVISLNDASRQNSERMEALLYQMYAPGRTSWSASYTGRINGLGELLDDEALQSLKYLLPRMSNSQEPQSFLQPLLIDLSSVPRSTVTEMLLGFLETDMGSEVKSTIINGMGRRSGEPQVKVALERLVVTDADAQVRLLAAKALQALPVSR